MCPAPLIAHSPFITHHYLTTCHVQAARLFAEYFAAAWERKEAEAGEAAQALHRCQVRLPRLMHLPGRCRRSSPTRHL